MLRRWTAALLAASALFPLTALGQEVGGHVRAPHAMRADEAPRPPREAAPRGGKIGSNWQRPERPAGLPHGWVGQGNAGGWQHPDRNPAQPNGWERPDRGAGGNNWQRPQPSSAQPGGWQQRPARGGDQPRVWRGQSGEGQDRPRVWHPDGNGAGWQQRPDRQPGQSDWRDRRDRGADWIRRQRDWTRRSGAGRSWSDWNDHYRDQTGFRDRRDWAQGRSWYGDRTDWNGDGWNRDDWGSRGWNGGGHGGWNRDWRHDRRYDWSTYRASNRGRYRLPRYYAPYGWHDGYRRFDIGVTLDSLLFAQSYWIDDPWEYRLPPADGPYRWVRYYNDALLVDVDSGEVIDVIHDIFW